MDEHTGGDAVVDVLQRAGVRVLFGMPSVHNLPIYDAIARRRTLRAVTVRHEQAAAGAADAYARVSGSLGVLLTSTGPGAANAMGGLLEAYVSGSPVLHLTGQIETRFLDEGRGFIHEVPDQPAMLDAASKRVFRAVSADDIATVVAEAVGTALEWPRGPVSVELPIDLQYAEAVAEPPDLLDQLVSPGPCRAPDPSDVKQAADAIVTARRPLIWAGGGAVASGAGPQLQALARLIGAGVLTSPNGRGVLSERDPLCLGNLSWDRDVRQLLLDADLLIAVGTRYQGTNTENWEMRLPASIVQIDIDPGRPARNYPATVEVDGDASQSLNGILEQLSGRAGTEAAWSGRVRAAGAAARSRLRATLGAQQPLLDATERVLPSRTVVVKDSTIPAYTWGNRLLAVSRPRSSVMPNSFAIGLGLPHAIGAAAASVTTGDGEPVLLMVGDGGIMLSVGELATLAEEQLPVVVVCFCDGGYGILRNIQSKQYGRTLGVDLGRPGFVALAQALGVTAELVSSPSEYEASLERALERRAPSFLEVDLDALGPMAAPYNGTSKPPAA